ncbi:MAG: PKD domain-containing protein [Actinobacteria bacterium]|nr:MAG: PKD domain-containing protein [Actinomycetota bacterium]
MIWQVAGTASKPELSALGAPAVPSFEVPPNAPQPGTANQLDTSDARLTQAVAAPDPNAGGAEAVWTQHTIEGGAGSVVRWYEIVPGKLEVRQVGTISEPGKFVFNGAIAPTLSGGAVVNYNTASSSAFVQLMAQSRIGSAPLGTMNTSILLASSSAADVDFSCPSETKEKEPCRWGDYAGASVDPTSEDVVWGSNQTNGLAAGGFAQWRTRNFALEPNDLVPVASFTIVPNPATAGSPAGFNGNASTDPDGTIASYSWNFGDGTAAGSGAVPTHVYGAPGTYTATLTVTDNGGNTSSVSQAVSVVAAPASSTLTPLPSEPAPKPKPSPNSGFSGHASFDTTTGAITVSLTVANSGIFRWLATFANGRFGVFAARAAKCKAGQIRLKRKCRPAKVTFGRGSKAVAAAGPVIFTIKPTAAGRKALKTAAKHKKGLPVTLTITYQSALGGAAVTHTAVLSVKLKR